MPGSGKGAKGGAKKLTKAEKERLKKEEDEKKARDEGDGEEDEEEARLRAEREEQEKKDREKNEAEERRRLENESSAGHASGRRKSSSRNKSSVGLSSGRSTSVRRQSGVSTASTVRTEARTMSSKTEATLDASHREIPRSRLNAKSGASRASKQSPEIDEEQLRLEKLAREEKERQLVILIDRERKRRKGQLVELDKIWDENRTTLAVEKAERLKAAKWERYMLCDGSPDPTIQGEINTYMNLWKEDKNSNDIHNVLKESRLALSLMNELNQIRAEADLNNATPEDVIRYKDTVKELQEMLHDKLELASHDLLMKATQLADSETANLQQTIANDMITLCMWGNLSKNPRIKQFEFDKKGITFEIPKVLTLSDCSVRILFTKYDHLSPKCTTYYSRLKKLVEEPVEEEPQDNGEEKKEEGEGEGKEGEGEEGEDKPELEREDTEDVMAALKQMEEEKEEVEEEEKKEEEPEEEALEEEYDIPTPEPVEWEDFEGDDDAIDLRANHIMGDIFHFNLLTMPPQPKVVRDWTIVQVEEPACLKYMEYMADSGVPASAKSKDDKDKDQGDEEAKKREEKPPIGVTLRLPEDVYFCEEPQVVRWNEETSQWRLDGFSDHAFNEENRILTYKTTHFGTMALVQDAHINMPFQSWELRPHKANSAIFTVIAAIVEVEIEIKDGECCLNVPDERKELEHLKNVWLPPQQFIKRMRAAGMNIFPAEDSSKYVSIQNKSLITEDRLYQQIALTASSMAYSWSKWNSEIKDSSKIVIQGTEHLQDEPLLEEDWSMFLITKKRVTKLRMTEFDEKFSEDHAEGTEFHADLYHMSMELMSEDGKSRVNETNYQFTDTIYQLLSAVKPVTYS